MRIRAKIKDLIVLPSDPSEVVMIHRNFSNPDASIEIGVDFSLDAYITTKKTPNCYVRYMITDAVIEK